MKFINFFLCFLIFALGRVALAETVVFTNYYDNDLHGSPVATTDEQGRLIQSTDYYPYGWRPRNEQSLGYTGHAQDSASELIYMGARHYDPLLGRFLSIDPVGPVPSVPGSFNRYSYAQNNPYRFVDPNGEWVEDVVIGVPSILLGGASLVENLDNGNWGAAVVDVAGIVLDGAAIGTPFVPGGAGLSIAGSRKLAETGAKQVVKNAPDAKYGEFSIIDWSGYPAGVPKPEGPFRIVEGAEYDAARKAADAANRRIRRDQNLKGVDVHIHELNPVKFGGSPTDPVNKYIIDRGLHSGQVTPWWNKLQKDLGH